MEALKQEPRLGERGKKKPAKAVGRQAGREAAKRKRGLNSQRMSRIPNCNHELLASQPTSPGPCAIGSPSQSGGVSQTNARIAITQRS